jgi:hypothetical protein
VSGANLAAKSFLGHYERIDFAVRRGGTPGLCRPRKGGGVMVYAGRRTFDETIFIERR